MRPGVVVLLTVALVGAAILWQTLPPGAVAEARLEVWLDEPRAHPAVENDAELALYSQELQYRIDSRPVAEETARRLGLKISPAELLDALRVEQGSSPRFIVITYRGGTDAQQARRIVRTVAEVSADLNLDDSGLVAKVI